MLAKQVQSHGDALEGKQGKFPGCGWDVRYRLWIQPVDATH
jgi:hypothetical protein